MLRPSIFTNNTATGPTDGGLLPCCNIIKEKIDHERKIIEILNEICPRNDFENETAIIDDGIIDSLDIVAVISELMEEFDVQLGVNDLTPENFNSVDAIVELIENAQE